MKLFAWLILLTSLVVTVFLTTLLEDSQEYVITGFLLIQSVGSVAFSLLYILKRRRGKTANPETRPEILKANAKPRLEKFLVWYSLVFFMIAVITATYRDIKGATYHYHLSGLFGLLWWVPIVYLLVLVLRKRK
jgi:membrane associated rhomboid family serine protease